MKTLMNRSTIHGTLDLYEAKTWRMKTFWAFVIATAIVLATVEIYHTVITYLENPISTGYAIGQKSAMKFPDVYLCPLNVVNKENINFFYQIGMAKQFLGMHQNSNGKVLEKINKNYEIIQQFIHRSRSGPPPPPPTVITYFDRVSLTVDQFVLNCQFQSQSYACRKVTKRLFDGNYGQCFLIEAPEQQTTAGIGLRLILDIRSDLYHKKLLPPFDGVYVRIADKFDPAGFSGGIFVEPGGLTKINLFARRYQLINVASGRVTQVCINRANYSVLNYDGYTMASCKLDCAQEVSLRHCDCVAPLDNSFLLSAYHQKHCNFDRTQACFYNNVLKTKQEEILNCSQKCTTPCNYWEYSTTLNKMKFSTGFSAEKKALNSFDDQDISNEKFNVTLNKKIRYRDYKDIIMLNIGFSDTTYTEIVQSPSMTTDTFLGNVGGQACLWLGVSMISLVQLFVYTLVFCCEKCRKIKI